MKITRRSDLLSYAVLTKMNARNYDVVGTSLKFSVFGLPQLFYVLQGLNFAFPCVFPHFQDKYLQGQYTGPEILGSEMSMV